MPKYHGCLLYTSICEKQKQDKWGAKVVDRLSLDMRSEIPDVYKRQGEVYAFSSAFTALVFWLILKWEDHADEPHSDRWLVLIAYMTGLSIGVHLLSLIHICLAR